MTLICGALEEHLLTYLLTGAGLDCAAWLTSLLLSSALSDSWTATPGQHTCTITAAVAYSAVHSICPMFFILITTCVNQNNEVQHLTLANGMDSSKVLVLCACILTATSIDISAGLTLILCISLQI